MAADWNRSTLHVSRELYQLDPAAVPRHFNA
jgi:hypothetical protein